MRQRNGFGRKSKQIFLVVQLIALCQLALGTPMASAKEKLDNDNTVGDEYSDPALRPAILPPEEKKLPTRPEDVPPPRYDNGDKRPQNAPSGEPEIDQTKGFGFVPPTNSTASATPTVLQGTADASSITATAELMTTTPLSRYRGENLVFYKVHIKNNGATPVVVLGRGAQVSGSAQSGKTIKATVLERHDNKLLTPKETAAVYAAGIGTAGLGSILFYEKMTPSEHRDRNLGLALGRDRGRHEVESEDLGTRLLMPGDDTLGWLAFDAGLASSTSSLGVPVMFPPYNSVAATVQIPVTGKTSTPLPTPAEYQNPRGTRSGSPPRM